MSRFRVFFHRLRGLLFKNRFERELHDEIHAHIEMQADDYRHQGLPDEDARYAALQRFGGVDQVKETYRERRSLPLIETTIQDLRYGMRRLAKNPGFTVIAVLMLALGIGANMGMFSVINTVLLRPLPYKQPDRLMIMWNQYGDKGQRLPRVSIPDFIDYQQQSRTFEQFAAALEGTATLTGNTEPEQVDRAHITSDFFSLLGVKMYLGRDFTPEESALNGPNVLILSHRLWKRRFGGDPTLVGQTIQMNSQSYTVVGVLPDDFKWYPPPDVRVKDADVWDPARLDPANESRTSNRLTVLGRLKTGVSLAQAQSGHGWSCQQASRGAYRAQEFRHNH